MKMPKSLFNRVSEVQLTYENKVPKAERIKIKSTTCAEIFLTEIMENHMDFNEAFYAVFLNRANEILAIEKFGQGAIGGTAVDNQAIYIMALKLRASGVIVAHNHPSGSPKASTLDIQLTQKLKSALELLEVTLLDHIIVSREETYSMACHDLI